MVSVAARRGCVCSVLSCDRGSLGSLGRTQNLHARLAGGLHSQSVGGRCYDGKILYNLGVSGVRSRAKLSESRRWRSASFLWPRVTGRRAIGWRHRRCRRRGKLPGGAWKGTMAGLLENLTRPIWREPGSCSRNSGVVPTAMAGERSRDRRLVCPETLQRCNRSAPSQSPLPGRAKWWDDEYVSCLRLEVPVEHSHRGGTRRSRSDGSSAR